jgi:Uma2 family endonuclease
LNGTQAEDCGEFWYGGPDFVVEVVSPRDRTRKKIPFYEKVGTRELLIIDRRPWQLTLLRLIEKELRQVGQSSFDQRNELASQVLPLSFQLAGDEALPKITIRHSDGRQWTIDAPPPKRREGKR